MSAPDLVTSLRKGLQGAVESDRPLAPLTTYRLGGHAAVCVEPASVEDVEAVADVLHEHQDVPFLVIGRGSNVVISDEGFPGLVVRMTASSWIRDAGSRGAISAGAGAALPQVANYAARRALGGAEWMISIPGSVGGAVRMNAGAHGRDMSDVLTEAVIFDVAERELYRRGPADLDMSYRHTCLGTDHVVLEATIELAPRDPELVRATMEGYRQHRAATQPPAAQNAGSVFKNPAGDSAGRLVEAAGLKGFRVGGAAVSELHANFFVADRGARAQDVHDLVHEVRERVLERFGIELEPEIRFVGSFEERVPGGAR